MICSKVGCFLGTGNAVLACLLVDGVALKIWRFSGGYW